MLRSIVLTVLGAILLAIVATVAMVATATQADGATAHHHRHGHHAKAAMWKPRPVGTIRLAKPHKAARPCGDRITVTFDPVSTVTTAEDGTVTAITFSGDPVVTVVKGRPCR